MTGAPKNKQPVLPFSNDGSFMEMFAKMQQAKEQQEKAAGGAADRAGEADGGAAAAPPPPPPADSQPAAKTQQADGSAASGSTEQQGGGSTSAEQQQAPAPPAAAAGGQDAQPGAGSADTSSRPRSAPAVVIKPKKSIVQVRTRSGETLQPGGSKRAKKDGQGAAAAAAEEPQSFYLKELQRYREAACEGSSGDRPLVK